MRRLSLIGTIAAVFVLASAMPADSFAAPPANDNFADAQLLDGVGGAIYATNVEATKEPGEPAHAGDPGGASIWFRWTAPWRGDLLLNADSFLTLAVYTGTSVDALTEVASSATGGGIRFKPVKGTTYAIAVDGVDGATSEFALYWRLLNDDFADAWPITGVRGQVYTCDWDLLWEGWCIGATREPGEPQHGVHSLWWRWTAPRTGWFRFQTNGMDCEEMGRYCQGGDSILAVYRGIRLASLKRVALNDHFVDEWHYPYSWIAFSALSFHATHGVTYRIALAETRDTWEGEGASLTWVPGRIIHGGPGNDILTGTPYSDYIKGHGGNDVIFGKRGADTLVGGPGDDVLHGGLSNDRLHGHWPETEYDSAVPQGNDRLFGELGWDHVRAGREDRIYSSERIQYRCWSCDWED